MSAHGGGKDRWLISYADFITLLMVLFIILYSMGQVDIEKYKQLAESLRVAFGGGGGAERVIEPGINQAGGMNEQGAPAPIVIPGIPTRPLTSSDVAAELTDLMVGSNLGGAVSVQNNIEGVFISLSEQLIFEPGTTNLQPQAFPVLDNIIKIIGPLDNEIKVVGHTDNIPPADPSYRSNWELSMARALTVVEYMQAIGIQGYRLNASGRGEYQPLFPNDTPEHRALNNRVEILVIYKVDNDIFNLGGK